MASNIPSIVFHGSIFSELLSTARYTLRINDFTGKTADLLLRMIAPGGNRAKLTKQLKKGFHHYPFFKNLVKLLRRYVLA